MPKRNEKAAVAGRKAQKARVARVAPIKEQSAPENAPHVPTEANRTIASLAVAAGFTQEQIARMLDISEPTLRKHYARELTEGAERANLKIAGNLYRIATQTTDNKAALTACIFWMKTRMRWRETADVEAQIESNGPVRVTLKLGEREGTDA